MPERDYARNAWPLLYCAIQLLYKGSMEAEPLKEEDLMKAVGFTLAIVLAGVGAYLLNRALPDIEAAVAAGSPETAFPAIGAGLILVIAGFRCFGKAMCAR